MGQGVEADLCSPPPREALNYLSEMGEKEEYVTNVSLSSKVKIPKKGKQLHYCDNF